MKITMFFFAKIKATVTRRLKSHPCGEVIVTHRVMFATQTYTSATSCELPISNRNRRCSRSRNRSPGNRHRCR